MLEKSGKFVSPKMWEPCSTSSEICFKHILLIYYSYCIKCRLFHSTGVEGRLTIRPVEIDSAKTEERLRFCQHSNAEARSEGYETMTVASTHPLCDVSINCACEKSNNLSGHTCFICWITLQKKKFRWVNDREKNKNHQLHKS